VQKLQEQLSARYAREAKYEEELDKYKNVVISLSESAREAKDLKSKVGSLNEQLTHKNNLYKDKETQNRELNENLNSVITKYNSLKENYKVKSQRVLDLEKSLEESYSLSKEKEKSLKESLEELKQNSIIKSKEYT
jgi:chromosome segregation ATPase